MENSDLRLRLEEQHGSSFGWALSCCGRNQAEAEEVLQLVYLKILEGKALFRGEASFKTWLFAVIRKTAADEQRKRLLRALVRTRAELLVTDSAVNPVLELERSETHARFRRALDRLPKRQRETLHLVFYEDMSLNDAAEVIGISVGAVRKHYARAKSRLRELMEQESGYGIQWRREKNPSAVS